MNSDNEIVARLRIRPNNHWMLEAADEIERLRKEVQTWKSLHRDLWVNRHDKGEHK